MSVMLTRLAMGMALLCTFVDPASAAVCTPTGSDLILNNVSCTLSGIHTYGTITLTKSTITVDPYTGGDKNLSGNLELRAKTITIDSMSKIIAKGSGYKTLLCGNGVGPTADAGGRGGCSVRDSGGGGAHFGGGGRGTIDNPTVFPRDYEENCSAPLNATTPPLGGGAITVTYAGNVASCHLANGTAIPNADPNEQHDCDFGGAHDSNPTVAGQIFYHSIYQPEFGASGGDKGCLDGDGLDPADNSPATDLGIMVGGNGGGRIVLAGLNAGAGTVSIDGELNANGKRGCGIGNDSGGGGAGGTILVVGETVTIGATALITAAGGLGGDTQGLSTDPTGECVAPAQQNQTADDCGGGGGGGIVSVLSVTGNINDEAVFSVNGAIGGVSTLCKGEAGGGVGELQISNGYVGELCDGFDNDFDNSIDEGFPMLACPGMSKPSCFNGVPQQCAADVPACEAPVTDSRARFAVIVDTSGSMLGTLPGIPTFGDGSFNHPGHDFDGNGIADDSRLFKAKTALTNVIAGYPDIDFALARYHQDESLNRSCQESHNFECNSICCSYDDPSNNTGLATTPACSLDIGTGTPIVDKIDSPANTECINYAGTCGPPRRGADVLVGFGADINNYLMWLDGKEANFNASNTVGAFCDFPGGGDCELRGTGPTPLANSLNAIEDYLGPIKDCDKASIGGCRKYGVILLTDGAESCQGDPAAAATALRNKGISTYVIGFSTLPAEAAQLNQVAANGGTGSAFLVGDDNALANALATIVSGSIVFETCNNLDDDCDGVIDEGFTKGGTCDNGQQGQCRASGTFVCTADGLGVTCNAPTITPGTEICNGLDDDCDGKIDEGVTGCTCIAQGETCNNMDDDCDNKIDENITRACGTGVCQGIETCAAGVFAGCTAKTPTTEICNKLDDDCDGVIDGFTQACSTQTNGFPVGDPRNNQGNNPGASPGCVAEGPSICVCHPGTATCPANGTGVFGACTGEVGPTTEICNGLDDDCDGTVDEDTAGQDCSTNCGIGTTACIAGVITCNAVTAMMDDTCDGIDDDCDGLIDEDYVSTGACDIGLQCNGMDRCINGTPTCVGGPIGTEICNCADDDCDNTVDENVTCGSGASCTHCQCAFPCDNSEFPCPLGKACVGTFCVTDPCFTMNCPMVGGDKGVCVIETNAMGMDIGVCHTACSQVTCSGGLVCKPDTGECVANNCGSFPELCTAQQVCISGTCTTNPCAGVMCPTAEYCVGVSGVGTCVNSCAGVDCAMGERCELGTCQPDPCGSCPAGQVCRDSSGQCQADPCNSVLCPQGQWCDPHGDGSCTNDACVGTACPSPDQVCRGGTCDDRPSSTVDAPEAQYITTGGGGGCSTGGGGGLAIGLALLGLVRRKRGAA